MIRKTVQQNYSLNIEIVPNISIQKSNSSVKFWFCGVLNAKEDSSLLYWVSLIKIADLPLSPPTLSVNKVNQT